MNFVTICREGDFARVQEMVRDGLTLENVREDNCFSLRMAIRHGHSDIVKLLIGMGVTYADLRYDRDYSIKMAIKYKHVDILQMILDLGDLTFTDEIQDMAYHCFRNGGAEIVGMLVDYGLTEEGFTPDTAIYRFIIDRMCEGAPIKSAK